MKQLQPDRILSIDTAFWWVLHGKEYHRTLGHTSQKAVRDLISKRRKEKRGKA